MLHHKHLGVHVEKLASHCGLFDFDSPLYDAPKIVVYTKGQEILLGEIVLKLTSKYSNSFFLSLPARGPPFLA